MKYYSIFYIFRPIWKKFGAGDMHENLWSDYEFRENRHEKIHTLRRVVNKLTATLSTFIVPLWMKIGILSLHVMLLNSCVPKRR
jgi:hypothetical protein